MEEPYLQDIYIYPVKSLGGISVTQAEVQQTGLQYDRRWMLTDIEGNFLSQRKFVQMAMLQVSLLPEGLLVSHKKGSPRPLTIPFDTSTGPEITVSIWDDTCTALEVSVAANEWFSQALGMPARLVYMPATTHRPVDTNYAGNNEIVSFADAYPLIIIGQSSLDELNSRLEHPILMNRFRPNLVFNGGAPFCEDSFGSFQIGNVSFNAVKPCSRCVLTTINQEDGSKGQEPLKTLSTYRTHKNKILFGQNLLQKNFGTIKTGDKLRIQA
jgi:uncharacterized protein YcbX